MLYTIVLLYTSVLLYNTIDLKVLCSCVISCYYLSKMGEQAIKSMGMVFHGKSQIGERGGWGNTLKWVLNFAIIEVYHTLLLRT